jgi:hypothetical protein
VLGGRHDISQNSTPLRKAKEAGVARSPLTIAFHVVFVGALIAIPLVAPAVLPAPPRLEAPTLDTPERPVPETHQLPAIENSGAAPSAPVRPGGNVRPPTKIKDVKPIYPVIAQSAHVEGTVIIEATIGPSGKIRCEGAALASLARSRRARCGPPREFTPTLLNGSPVSMVMTVTVDFRRRLHWGLWPGVWHRLR